MDIGGQYLNGGLVPQKRKVDPHPGHPFSVMRFTKFHAYGGRVWRSFGSRREDRKAEQGECC